MLRSSLILLLLTGALSTQSVAQARKTVDCYCTDKSGARVELGETRCMNVDGRIFMAKCEMSLNVPMWRDQKIGCITS
jgi:hypothetical protein